MKPRTEVITIVVTIVGVVVAWLAWQYPKTPIEDAPTKAKAADPSPPSSTMVPEPAPITTPRKIFLPPGDPDMRRAIDAAAKLPYSDTKTKELDRLTRVSLERREWDIALSAAAKITLTDPKNAALELVACYSAQAGDYNVADAAIAAMSSDKSKQAAILNVSRFASLRPGEGSNDNECPSVYPGR